VTEDELVAIVNSLLGEGVPPGIVARVFGLDEELIKQQLKTVRVDRYGTADYEEYLEQVQWDVLEHARRTLAEGNAVDKARVMSMVMSKSMANAGKRVPDSVKEGRDKLAQVAEQMKGGAPAAPRPRSRFVAIDGGGEGA
jgi:hypothetical protein